MDRVKAMKVFIAVAEKQGFAAASRHLEISTSAVSRYVADLETLLGVQLFRRTTRSIRLTDVGITYLERCTKIVNEIDALDDRAQHDAAEPAGEIRVTASVFLGKTLLVPVIRQFLESYPDVKVDLLLLDRTVDLVDEGIDAAIRVGRLPDASYIARTLDRYRMTLVAAPAYLEQHGTPRSIKELDAHNCLVDRVPRFGDRWPLNGPNGRVSKRVEGNFVVNDGETVRDLARGGLGVTYLPDFFVREDVKAQRLIPILSESVSRTGEISIVYPASRYESKRARAFIDFVVRCWPKQSSSLLNEANRGRQS